MDPSTVSRRACARRLPRTRGDGPSTMSRLFLRSAAPPHTRGWTARSVLLGRGACGSPAHAGMDPWLNGVPIVSRGLPRTRGDGPIGATPGRTRRTAPPHTRGWTRRGVRPGAGRRGSPAHAGMDPRRERRERSVRWLPRTRGDGPLAHALLIWLMMASPHTRGWTPAWPRGCAR